MMRAELIVTIIIPGFHYWDGAKNNLSFLSELHYHNFKIVTYKSVDTLDREIEFFEFADSVKEFVYSYFTVRNGPPKAVEFGTMSCEQIAAIIASKMKLTACEVWEDELMGAKVYL